MSFLSSRMTIIVLTLITATFHLILGIRDFGEMLGNLFVLNSLGYLGLLYATFWTPAFLKGQASLVRWAFMAFVAITIVMYFVFNGLNLEDFVGLFVKLVEVLLLIGLWQSKKS